MPILFACLLLGGVLVLECLLVLLEVLDHLVPNGLKLVVDECRRNLEGMAIVESVEQRPLHLLTRGHGAVFLKAGLDGLAHLRDRLDAKTLGELLVESRRFRRRDLFDLHREQRRFTSK